MKISISEHFTYRKLLRFALPSIGMMVFTSIYGVVDGFFVSNYAGKTAFAAINLIMPYLMMIGGAGFMIGTGGSALTAMQLGQGKKEMANRTFSMCIEFSVLLGAILTVVGILCMEPVSRALGASKEMLPDCVLYGTIIVGFGTAFILQNVFQALLVTAEKPHLGLLVTIGAGVTNMVLDYVFVGVCDFGVAGAAWATGMSQCVGGLIPLVYFLLPNRSLLRIRAAALHARTLWQICANGASELMTNISSSVISMVFNFQLMLYAGENGVAAYGVLMYACFIFIAVFIGYAVGTAPIVSYHFGAQNHGELRNLLKKSLICMAAGGIAMVLFGELFSGMLAAVFVSYDAELLAMTTEAFRIFAFSFLLAGVNIYASSFFTALNNGAVSAAISFLRTLVFQLACVFLLPLFLGINGIWSAVAVAETLAFFVSLAFLLRGREKYHY